jgi:hypothetical protein
MRELMLSKRWRSRVKMEAERTSETFVSHRITTQRHIPDDDLNSINFLK